MKVHSVIRKGADHLVFCEDFLTIHDEGRYFVGAVFDGCSGGRDSHFASSLFGKIFTQILSENSFVTYGNTIEERSKNFLRTFVNKLFQVKVMLDLDVEKDLVATFIALIYDKVHGEALIISIGDGVINCDGVTTVFENDFFKFSHPEKYSSMPNYISYSLVDLGLDKSSFDIWYERNVRVDKFIDPKDISISSDGISTFNRAVDEIDVVDFLLNDQTWMNNAIMMSKKVNVLKSKHNTVHKDDISIIRLSELHLP